MKKGKVSNKHKRAVADFASAARSYMSLDEWEADIEFIEFQEDDIFAEIAIMEEYLSFTIRVNEKLLADAVENNRPDRVKDVVVHELCHVIIDPLYFLALDAQTNATMKFLEKERERAVCRVAAMVLKGFKGSLMFNK